MAGERCFPGSSGLAACAELGSAEAESGHLMLLYTRETLSVGRVSKGSIPAALAVELQF